MLERLRKTLAKAIAPSVAPRTRSKAAPKQVVVSASRQARPLSLSRMYAAAKASRLTEGWGNQTTSEDSEMASSLMTMRNRSRALIRDAAYAQRAKVIVQNNVIGSGIGLQSRIMTSRGELNTRLNDAIEEAWLTWTCASSCHTGGALHFADFERACMGQVFEAGEIFIRKHYGTFGDSKIPLCLELIEAERIADQFQPTPVEAMHRVRLGVEVDRFYRPLAYWIRSLHPGEIRLTAEQTSTIERVPAQDIIHLRVIERWPQTRGVPWLHAVARRLNDMDGLGEAEIVAARAAACYMGFIESPAGDAQYGDIQEDGSEQAELQAGMIEKLRAGEKFNFAAPNRPNAQLDPFLRMMLREVSAGVGCSYESLSRDYSQSNYSSSRLALLDDRDLWRVLQTWFIRTFRESLHRIWLQQAVLAGQIPGIKVDDYAASPERFEAVRFKPRGWSWVDPVKEVDAYREAVRAGFMTVSDVIAMTGSGRDLEDVLTERRYELDRMAEEDLIFDTDPMAVPAPPKTTATNQPATEPTDESSTDQASTGSDGDDAAVRTAEQLLRERTSHV